MMAHQKTWRLWIDRISPISSNQTNITGPERDAMAEALAMAAPQGPVGFSCEDDCRCGLLTKSADEFRAGHDRAVRVMRAELDRIKQQVT